MLPSLLRRGRERNVPVRRESHPLWALQNEIDRLFEEFWRGFDLGPSLLGERLDAFQPRVDVLETDDEVQVTAELPGLEEKDFEVTLNGDMLVIRGEKSLEREETRGGYHRSERSYGSFERAIALPCEVDADKASAEYRHGVLRVTLPKTEQARERGRRIPVRAS